MENVGRNDPCPCGSGLKFKKCCWGKPAKLKFSAKVIKSGTQDNKLPEFLGKMDPSKEAKPFTMTDKDFRKQ